MKKRLFTLMAALLVLVTAHAATSYGFYVGGVEITSSNYTNIPKAIKDADASRLGDYVSIKYVPSTKTLTLSGVTIKRTGSSNRAITNESNKGLTVIFVGSNSLEAANASPILCKTTTYLQCKDGGKVVLKGNHNDGLTANGCTIHILEADMVIEAPDSRGIMSDNDNGEVIIKDSKVTVSGKNGAVSKLKSLTVQNSTLTLNGNNSAVTVNTLQSLVLDGSGYSNPSNVSFDATKKAIVAKGSSSGYKGTIEFVPALKISVDNFPDDNFRSYVKSFDTNNPKDNHLTDDELDNVKTIGVYDKGISNLKGIERFTALTELYCGENKLTSLNVSENTALTSLSCSSNQLTSLDVSKNTKLTELYCDNNQLKSLNVTYNTALIRLNCSSNQLTSLNVSKNTALEYLYCYSNQLTSLNVSKNTALTSLDCGINQLTSLNVSTNTALTDLACYRNQLTSLNVSKNTKLTTIYCYSNKIKGTNMSNFVNSLPSVSSGELYLNYFAGEGNESTYDDIYRAQNKRWKVQYYGGKGPYLWNDYAATTAIGINSTNFPDATFRAWVSTNADTYKDGFLIADELDEVKEINVFGKKITNLTGIKHFTALTKLSCGNNQLTSLDVSKNTALTELYCSGNQLTSLNVSKNTLLIWLDCYDNQLTSLDVSKNTALEILTCHSNQLTSLKVSTNTKLTRLGCNYNRLTSLDVSKNTALTNLYCYNNQLTSLDVSKNTALEILTCSNNQLTSLDVSKNTKLTTILCYGNQIKGTGMTNFVNRLPKTTGILELNFFPGEGNESVYEDIVTAQNKGWTVTYYYHGDLNDYAAAVGINSTNFPDANFRAWVSENADTYKDGFLIAKELDEVKEINVYYENISNLTGIERFTSLTKLDCFHNQLTSLDVSKNTALTYLDCYDNQLTSLDVSKNTALTYLGCYNNQLASLDVSKNTALTYLNCSNNQLTSLDVSKNKALTWLGCSQNGIKYEQMTSLVNSLPQVDDGVLLVQNFDQNIANENEFDTKLAVEARTKGWRSCYWENGTGHEYSTDLPTAIEAAPDAGDAAPDQPRYNLQGQRVGNGYRGIVIVNGKKIRK